MEVVRVGLVGLNERAKRLLIRGLNAAPHANLTALCSRDRAKAAAVAAELVPGAAVCVSVDDLASRPDIDAIYLNVPDEHHHPLALSALRAGKHVICEKPLAQTAGEAKEMTEAARRAGVRGIVNFTQRSQPAARLAARVLSDGTVGDLHHVALTVHQGTRLGGAGPRKDALLDSGSHGIDLLHWWLDQVGAGELCRVAAVHSAEDPERPPWWLCTFRTDRGVGVGLDVSKVAAGTWNVFALNAYGSKGALHMFVDGAGGRVELTRPRAGSPQGEREPVPLPAELQITYEDFPAYHMERLVQAVRGEGEFAMFEDGLRCQLALEAAAEAGRSGRWVEISYEL